MTGRERQQQIEARAEADAALATIRRMLREAGRLDDGDDPALWTNADDAALYLRGYAVTLEQRLDALAARLSGLQERERRIERWIGRAFGNGAVDEMRRALNAEREAS